MDRMILADIGSFLQALVHDRHFDSLRAFFDTLILEMYGTMEDAEGRDHPFPCLSMSLPTKFFSKVLQSGSTLGKDLSRYGELRWNSGHPVEPHRNLESPQARGAK
jgi:hypothetical protein